MRSFGIRGLRSLTTVALALLLLVAMGSTVTAATKIGDWKLRGNLKNSAGSKAKLEAVGLPEFKTVNVRGAIRKALVFDPDEGLHLTRVPKSARSSYSLLIYLEIDDTAGYRRIWSAGKSLDDPAFYQYSGRLSLYPYAESETAPIGSNEWNRLLITRDGRTNLMRFYVNGRLRMVALDDAKKFLIRDGTANFFLDDGFEVASGTVGNIQLYRGVLNP